MEWPLCLCVHSWNGTNQTHISLYRGILNRNCRLHKCRLPDKTEQKWNPPFTFYLKYVMMPFIKRLWKGIVPVHSDYREPPAGARRQMKLRELTLESLPEIPTRVDADGILPPLSGKGIRIIISRTAERMIFPWIRVVPRKMSYVSKHCIEAQGFFYTKNKPWPLKRFQKVRIWIYERIRKVS